MRKGYEYMDSGRWPSVVAWVVFGVSLALTGWLYLAPPTIHLRPQGPDVACWALGPEQFSSVNRTLEIDADVAVRDLMNTSLGFGSDSRFSPEQRATTYSEVMLETVASCQDARLNRQSAMMLALAVGLAAFGVGHSLRRSRAQAIGSGEIPTEGKDQ